jgi:transcriptional regulator with XRE-family HTH domain
MKAIYLRYIQYCDFMEDINRLKLVLVEKKKTGKWLAGQLGKNPSTVSKWCSNVAQPDLVTLVKIASLLNVDVQELINKQ